VRVRTRTPPAVSIRALKRARTRPCMLTPREYVCMLLTQTALASVPTKSNSDARACVRLRLCACLLVRALLCVHVCVCARVRA